MAVISTGRRFPRRPVILNGWPVSFAEWMVSGGMEEHSEMWVKQQEHKGNGQGKPWTAWTAMACTLKWMDCLRYFRHSDVGHLATSTWRKALSVLMPSSLQGPPGESQVEVKRCLCWGSLRAVMQMHPVNVLCSIYQKCWTNEHSFPGAGISDSAALTLESLIKRRMLGPTPELRSRSGWAWDSAFTSPRWPMLLLPGWRAPERNPVPAFLTTLVVKCWARSCLRRKLIW